MASRRQLLCATATALGAGCLRFQDPTESSAGSAGDGTTPETGSPTEGGATGDGQDGGPVPAAVALSERWTAEQTHVSHQLVVGQEHVFASHADGFAAFDIQDRSTSWVVDVDLSARSPVRLVEGRVFLGSETGVMGFVDHESGTLEQLGKAENPIRGVGVGTDVVAYCTRVDDSSPDVLPRVYAYERETGELVSEFVAFGDTDSIQIFAGSPSLLVVVDGVVYTGLSSRIEGFDLGTSEWSEVAAVGPSTAPAVDGTVAYLGRESTLYAIDLETGEERWTATIFGDPVSDVVHRDGTVFLADHAGVVAVDATDGSERWRDEFRAEVAAGPVVENGVCWYVDPDGLLRAREIRNGSNVIGEERQLDTVYALDVRGDVLAHSTPSLTAVTVDYTFE